VVTAAQRVERLLIRIGRVALAQHGRTSGIGDESEPVQILEQRRFELRPAADPVVILDPQQHLRSAAAGEAPDVDRVHDVTQVHVACWGRRKSGLRHRHL
jgi:hypothetical protein